MILQESFDNFGQKLSCIIILKYHHTIFCDLSGQERLPSRHKDEKVKALTSSYVHNKRIISRKNLKIILSSLDMTGQAFETLLKKVSENARIISKFVQKSNIFTPSSHFFHLKNNLYNKIRKKSRYIILSMESQKNKNLQKILSIFQFLFTICAH